MSSPQCSPNVENLSKKQLKKLARRKNWLATKDFRKAKQKEKRKRRILESREAETTENVTRKKIKLMKDSSCQQRVAIDLSQDHRMTDAELCKTIKQLQRCYSLNRRSPSPLQLYFTSFNNAVKTKMDSVQPGCKNWDVYLTDKHYTEEFTKEDVVYLSSESPVQLRTLESSKVYIIGGLVDHNRYKGLCYNLAQEQGIQHAQLPLDEFLIMKTRKVLTIDHVFSILLSVANGSNWKEAFLSVLPQRKGAKVRESNLSDNEHLQEEVEKIATDEGEVT